MEDNNLKKKQVFNYDKYNNTYYYIEVLYDESNTKKKPMKLSDLKKHYNKQQGVNNQWTLDQLSKQVNTY